MPTPIPSRMHSLVNRLHSSDCGHGIHALSRHLLALLFLAVSAAPGSSAESPTATPQANAAKPPDFRVLTMTTEKVATAYFNNYFKMEFDAMERLADPAVSFDDPTANTVFGGTIVSGREQTYAKMRQTFAGITHLAFRPTRKYFSGEHAVMEGVIDWTFKGEAAGQQISIVDMPLVIILQIHEGRVLTHRDFGDYRVFIRQYREQLTPTQ